MHDLPAASLSTLHQGGYTPFEADLTDIATPGEEIRVTVSVDNSLLPESIPPGEIVQVGRKTQQTYCFDFFNYAGLTRSVRLCRAPKIRLDDIAVVTTTSGDSGEVKYDLAVSGPAETIQVDLFDQGGERVAYATTTATSGTLTVPNVKLWQPGNAYLYRLRISIVHQSKLIDEYQLPIGIRTVSVHKRQVLINGAPFYFKGFARHEDTPIKGRAHDHSWMVHDFELMKSCGANSFRTAHYPHAEEVMEYADRHGWVVIGETPAAGINLNVGGGIIGPARRITFGPDFASSKTQHSHSNAIRELIDRDKNHPSVVMWCIGNEPDSSEPGSRPYFEPLVSLTRQLDPSRLVTFTNLTMVQPHQELIADLFDVIGINRYYGWYDGTGNLENGEIALEAELREWEKHFDKPLMMLEYGADTMAGLHSVHNHPWSEEYQASFYEMYGRVFDRIDSVVGEQVWVFADFSTGPAIHRVDGNRKGIFTRDRRPKASALTLKKRWNSLH